MSSEIRKIHLRILHRHRLHVVVEGPEGDLVLALAVEALERHYSASVRLRELEQEAHFVNMAEETTSR